MGELIIFTVFFKNNTSNSNSHFWLPVVSSFVFHVMLLSRPSDMFPPLYSIVKHTSVFCHMWHWSIFLLFEGLIKLARCGSSRILLKVNRELWLMISEKKAGLRHKLSYYFAGKSVLLLPSVVSSS